jgi:hypothetical protein
MVYYKNILFLKSQYQLKSNLGKSSEFSHTRIWMLWTILRSFFGIRIKIQWRPIFCQHTEGAISYHHFGLRGNAITRRVAGRPICTTSKTSTFSPKTSTVNNIDCFFSWIGKSQSDFELNFNESHHASELNYSIINSYHDNFIICVILSDYRRRVAMV